MSTFILPEKWCIRGIEKRLYLEKIKIFNDWKNNYFKEQKLGFYKDYYYFVENNTIHYKHTIPDNYTEITFEQFKQFVVNEQFNMVNKYDYLIKILNKLNIK